MSTATKSDNMLPIGPFAAWVVHRLELGDTWQDIAGRAGVYESSVRRACREQKHISLWLVDRVLVAHYTHLNEVYPFEEAA